MKPKYIFLVLTFFYVGNVMFGQTGTLYKSPLMGIDNIIRLEPTTGKHIAYSLVAGIQNHFILTDYNSVTDVTISQNLNIKDFEIIDGKVFFCGNNGLGSGLIGWFDIDSLFSLQSNAYIDQTLSALGLLSLDNIEVYNDSIGNIHIAGYGLHDEPAANKKWYRAFEAVGTLSTGMDYRSLDLYAHGMYDDVTDMAVTDNLVVFLTTFRRQICPDHVGLGIILEPFPKTDMFGSSPFHYHYFQLTELSSLYPSYILPYVNDPYCDIIFNQIHPKMVHSFGDEIAVCTYRKTLDETSWILPTSPNDCGSTLSEIETFLTHLTFDLSPLAANINSAITMTSNVIAKLYNGNLGTINDIIYEPQSQRYAILHRHETSAGISEHAVTTFNFLLGPPTNVESSYQIAHNTSSGWYPESICWDGNLYYSVMGYDQSTFEYVFWNKSIVAANGDCDKIIKYPVIHQPLIGDKNSPNYIKPTGWLPILFQAHPILASNYENCFIICN